MNSLQLHHVLPDKPAIPSAHEKIIHVSKVQEMSVRHSLIHKFLESHNFNSPRISMVSCHVMSSTLTQFEANSNAQPVFVAELSPLCQRSQPEVCACRNTSADLSGRRSSRKMLGYPVTLKRMQFNIPKIGRT